MEDLPPQRSSTAVGMPLSELREQRSAELAQVFKALGDPVRLRIMSIVAGQAGREACVNDVLAAFALSQPTISHHLKVLRDVGLLTSERRAQRIYYCLDPQMLAELSALLTIPAEAAS